MATKKNTEVEVLKTTTVYVRPAGGDAPTAFVETKTGWTSLGKQKEAPSIGQPLDSTSIDLADAGDTITINSRSAVTVTLSAGQTAAAEVEDIIYGPVVDDADYRDGGGNLDIPENDLLMEESFTNKQVVQTYFPSGHVSNLDDIQAQRDDSTSAGIEYTVDPHESLGGKSFRRFRKLPA